MKERAIKKLQRAFQSEDLTDYQCIPFWSWNNELDESALVKQIEEMKQAGIGGFIMHARTGLKTEYLGEKWFSCIEACLKKAKELHMNAWVYDENGWPSGFVGGKLLDNEAYRARFLTYEVKDSFDERAFCVFKRTGSGFVRLHAPTATVTEYHTVYLHVSPANTDILNPEVVEAFIEATHEEYYKRFKDSFGKELVGFFTDEPQYYRWSTPYTSVAEKVYRDRYGEDIKDGLAYLFVQDQNGYVFRERYYQLLNELFTENFVKRLYEWCEAHNCKLTGHMVEEGGLCHQMWGGAAVTPPYEYEHIPGIDSLGRRCLSDLAVRQVSSASSQLNKKQVLTETFALCGYDVTPRELRGIAQHQFFGGVSLMCQHLLPMSVAAQGKYDHPPVFSKHGNWWEEFKIFNDYFTRLGYIVANTQENYDVAVVHPMRSIYLTFTRKENLESVKKEENYFKEFLLTLRKKGLRYHLLDERLLSRHGSVSGETLRLGVCDYSAVIVPDMKTISATTLSLLNDYQGKLYLGGKLTMIDGKEAEIGLTSNTTLDELIAARGIKFTCEDGNTALTSRKGALGDFIFLANTSQTEESRVTLEGVEERYVALDLETLTTQPISNTLTLRPFEGLVLIADDEAKPTERQRTAEDITANFSVQKMTKNSLILDYAQYSLDGKNYSDRQPIQMLFDTLLRMDYKGQVYIRQTFTAKDKVPARLLIEKGNFATVTFNGKTLPLEKSDFDIYFVETELTPYIKEGENELLYCVNYFQHAGVWFALFDPLATESVRNCLYYDTHIESSYIEGDFLVDETQALVKGDRLPPLTSDTPRYGYPFFKGEMTLKGSYSYDGVGKRYLSLNEGRFLVAEIAANGKKKSVVLDTEREITDLLQVGENTLTIKLRSGLRNFFGPHHNAPCPEPMGVAPQTFTLRTLWKDGIPKEYTHEYFSVPFGLDRITVLTQK